MPNHATNISVCMATYRGARFLRPQVDSILAQLKRRDELVVVDDGSEDDTLTILESYRDPRIKIFRNDKNLGHVWAFARAISLAENELLMLADQDDIWLERRVERIKKALDNPGTAVVAGNLLHIDSQGELLGPPQRQLRSDDSRHPLRNIAGIFLGRRPYYGCAMAFRRAFRDTILPIPEPVESHDLWIAMLGNIQRNILHLDAPLTARRLHPDNVSSPTRRPLSALLKSRWGLLLALTPALLRRAVRR